MNETSESQALNQVERELEAARASGSLREHLDAMEAEIACIELKEASGCDLTLAEHDRLRALYFWRGMETGAF